VSFNDRDVKRIKNPGVMITDGDIEALLARLEAAEAIVQLDHTCDPPMETTMNGFCCMAAEKAEKEWRAKAGKGKARP
jgi:hypothetical protein